MIDSTVEVPYRSYWKTHCGRLHQDATTSRWPGKWWWGLPSGSVQADSSAPACSCGGSPAAPGRQAGPSGHSGPGRWADPHRSLPPGLGLGWGSHTRLLKKKSIATTLHFGQAVVFFPLPYSFYRLIRRWNISGIPTPPSPPVLHFNIGQLSVHTDWQITVSRHLLKT